MSEKIWKVRKKNSNFKKRLEFERGVEELKRGKEAGKLEEEN